MGEYGEPRGFENLEAIQKVISGLRMKRETSLLLEALDALGDFQATRGAGNVGRAAGLSPGSLIILVFLVPMVNSSQIWVSD